MFGHPDPDAAPDRNPHDLQVPVAPVGGGRRSRGPWITLAAIVAVIGLALAASRLFPAGPPPSQFIVPTPTPLPTAPPTPTAIPVLSADQLREQLNAGTLRGSLVLADGTLDRVAVPCNAAPGDCWTMELRGLEGVPITLDVAIAPSAATLLVRGELVFRAGPATLTYLGRAPDAIDHPVAVAEIVASTTDVSPGVEIEPESLAAVRGWLVVGGLRRCTPPSSGPMCPFAPPWLTDDQPTPEGLIVSESGMSVQLDANVRPLAAQVVTPGPFLLRYITSTWGGLPPWHLVALLGPEHVVRVRLP